MGFGIALALRACPARTYGRAYANKRDLRQVRACARARARDGAVGTSALVRACCAARAQVRVRELAQVADPDLPPMVPPWRKNVGRRRGNARHSRQSLFCPSGRPPAAATCRVWGQRGRRGRAGWYAGASRAPSPQRAAFVANPGDRADADVNVGGARTRRRDDTEVDR